MKSTLSSTVHRGLLHLSGIASILTAATVVNLDAEVKVPSIFGNHMVLQQGQPNRVWGWADDGEQVTVAIAGQTKQATASAEGRWEVTLSPLPAGGPHQMKVMGKNTLLFEDVLVGEVWICSGQSNMQWPVNSSNDPDLEKLTANYPHIRMISVPQVGTQQPQDDFRGQWELCTPKTTGDFSGVGYFFGRLLHQTLDVPIGLIDNAWGGSAAEAWIKRDILKGDDTYHPLMEGWENYESTYDHEQAMADYQGALEQWEKQANEAREANQDPPQRPRRPRNLLNGNHRPANIYNGVLKPTIGYGIRGVIWYQGESNAGRAYQYRDLFPLMIKSWRDEWGQGEFPFYFVQLADFREEKSQPAESDWAELREAQTMTLDRLANVGQAVIIDLGEAHDIHPKNKQGVAERLVRWALAQQYGHDIAYRSPEYQSMEIDGNKIVITFDHVGQGLDTFDVREPKGFAIAGRNKRFVWANAKIAGKNQVEVWSDDVADPVAVRYAWADNPVCNLQSREGLPATPFRTDTWPGITAHNKSQFNN